MKKTTSSSASATNTQATALRRTIEEAEQTYRRINQTRRLLSISFLRGVASVLGAIATVVIFIPVAIKILSLVEWPGIIGELVTEIILQIEQSSRR